MLEFKINHKWWHFLFTKLIRVNTHNWPFEPERTYVTYYCSKCKLKHILVLNEVDELLSQTTEEIK